MGRRKQLGQYMFVIRELVNREIKRKYSRSYLGILWSVLNPLLSMAVISAIFSTLFKRNIENFPIYYLTGFIMWNLFTGATNAAMTSLVDNKMLLIKVKLPMVIFPLSRVVAALVNFGYSFIAYIVMLLVFRVEPSITMLFLPVVVFAQFLFSIGISYILTVAYVFFGDIKHLYSVLLTLLMYCSAIFYPVEAIGGVMAKIIERNPIYNFIACARCCMMYGTLPTGMQLLRMIIWSVVVYLLGTWVFRRTKNKIMQKV